MPSERNRLLAIISLVSGIISVPALAGAYAMICTPYDGWLALLTLVTGLAAIVCAVMVRKRSAKPGARRATLMMARAGAYLGYAWLAVVVFICATMPNITCPILRTKVARAKSELRNLAVCLEYYATEHGTYPRAMNGSWDLIPLNENGSAVSAGFVPWLLTTPVAYKSSLPVEVFPERGLKSEQPYRYATNGTSCWIMAGNGPDEEVTVDVAEFPASEIGDCSWGLFLSHFGVGKAIEYDSSNGTTSQGDILRVGSQ